MKKKYISLIAALAILPISLSANNAQWATKNIYVYDKPLVTSPRIKLSNYKKFDTYNVLACDYNGWCLSNDGYVKKYVLNFKEEIALVKDLSAVNVNKVKQIQKQINTPVKKIKQTVKLNIKKEKDINKVVNSNVIDLSIKDLIKEVVKRNPNILFDKIQGDILDSQIAYEDAMFTPQFYVNLTHQDSNTPNNTETTLSRGYLSTYSEKTNNIEVGMTGVLPSGAKWNTSLKSNDKQSNVIDKYKEYDTEFDDSVEISVSQPLLKGYGSEITKSKYHLAKADKEIYLKQYKKRLMDVMGSVIQTYWKYYGAIQLQHSWKESLKINKQTIYILKQRAQSGDVAYSEVLEAQSASMVREAELKNMNIEVNKIKNEILTLLNVSSNDNKDIQFNLVDLPDTKIDTNKILKENSNVEEYYVKALQNWPELAIAKEKLKKEQLQIDFTKDLARPQLDLISTASSTTLSDKRENSFYDDDFISFSVGLQFSMPLFNTQSNNAIQMAKLKKKQVELEIQTLDKGLYNAISTKLSSLKDAKDQVMFYENGLKIKQELYDYVQKGFNLGEKSIRDTLIQEEDIINYQRKLFNAIIDWKLSEASLDKAAGTLFDKYLSYLEIDKIEDIEINGILEKDTFGKIY